MNLIHLCRFDSVGARRVRALVVLICISITFVQPGYCPTGQASCEMEDMDDNFSMGVVCLIACDVPLQANDTAAPMLVSSVSFVDRPFVAEQSGGQTEPDLPPPRRRI
jgi:hypothetical protein